MLYTQDRTQQRQFLANAWQKFLNKKPLDPLEDQLTKVIEMHPEYHTYINDIESDYFPEQGEVNPFLHINLHLSLREQLSINQPIGIQGYYQKIVKKVQDPHAAEHKMMDCIAEMIFSSQKNKTPMDHQAYIHCLENNSLR
ncbi:MAG: DUF1841 family protein [Gammaproteobacteria bacterium]|uniref:DUF1841 domain-containing protein n=1 Tax=endosymbiont of Bathymodiolus septemdierum str. Myojin knoll TaxID=1303921 RepID=A0A0P0UQ94_9GAMM|nr:DUF1841 family protein [Bathymodiolus septemdierum thioautotrophic gill symbiont]RUA05141.1 MAG: DUF1841 family protein [Gammaproteobacteria bacterium]BAS67208.1 conserved hypothetical protein [endosymbiont of Bathymodiolus septemdierum str. Myojin knoll]